MKNHLRIETSLTLLNPLMLKDFHQILSSGPIILLTITLELGMVFQNVWSRVVGDVLTDISTSNIFLTMLFPAECYQNYQAVLAFGSIDGLRCNRHFANCCAYISSKAACKPSFQWPFLEGCTVCASERYWFNWTLSDKKQCTDIAWTMLTLRQLIHLFSSGLLLTCLNIYNVILLSFHVCSCFTQQICEFTFTSVCISIKNTGNLSK